MPHWKTLRDRRYVGAWAFKDGPITLIIDHVESHVIERPNRDPEHVPLMYMRFPDGTPFPYPHILPDCNCQVLEDMYGSSDSRDWEGKPATFTVGATTDPETGKPTIGVRIDPRRPALPKTPAEEAAELRKMEAEIARRRAAAGITDHDPPSEPAPAPELPPKPPAPLANTVPDLDLAPLEVTRVAS